MLYCREQTTLFQVVCFNLENDYRYLLWISRLLMYCLPIGDMCIVCVCASALVLHSDWGLEQRKNKSGLSCHLKRITTSSEEFNCWGVLLRLGYMDSTNGTKHEILSQNVKCTWACVCVQCSQCVTPWLVKTLYCNFYLCMVMECVEFKMEYERQPGF